MALPKVVINVLPTFFVKQRDQDVADETSHLVFTIELAKQMRKKIILRCLVFSRLVRIKPHINKLYIKRKHRINMFVKVYYTASFSCIIWQNKIYDLVTPVNTH